MEDLTIWANRASVSRYQDGMEDSRIHRNMTNNRVKEDNWLTDVGYILPSNEANEVQWVVLEKSLFSSNICICSPEFTLEEKKWNFVAIPSDGKTFVKNSDFIAVFVWNNIPNVEDKYAVNIKVTVNGLKVEYSYEDADTVKGFGQWNFFHRKSLPMKLPLNHYVNLFCTIRKTSADVLVVSEASNDEKIMQGLKRRRTQLRRIFTSSLNELETVLKYGKRPKIPVMMYECAKSKADQLFEVDSQINQIAYKLKDFNKETHVNDLTSTRFYRLKWIKIQELFNGKFGNEVVTLDNGNGANELLPENNDLDVRKRPLTPPIEMHLPKKSKETQLEIHEEVEVDEKKHYEDLIALNDVDLVSNVEKVECPVCFSEVEAGEGATLQECLHSFCRQCLIGEIMASETAVVKCPFQNEEYFCEYNLQEKEIKSLVTPDQYGYHLQKSLTTVESEAVNSFHCKMPLCPGWCFVEDNVNFFICPVCNSANRIMPDGIQKGMNHQQYPDVVLDHDAEVWKTEQDFQVEELKKNIEERPDVIQPTDINLGINDARGASLHEMLGLKLNELVQRGLQIESIDKGDGKSSEGKFETKSYQSLLALHEANLVYAMEKIECPVCLSDVEMGEGIVLQNCLHSFCQECLVNVIKFSETPVVKCPFMNEEYSCESNLQEKEIKFLVTQEVYERHLQKSIALAENQASNSFHCKTSDCPGWCLVEDNVNTFVCPVCNHRNCLTCAAIHEGMNCQQYQDDLVFRSDTSEEAQKTREYLENMVNTGGAMRCPQCRVVLMKKEGCDWFKCSMCQTEICWVTKGARWGPGGNGDTSGGCKCKVNGNRCHPKCNNCH